jgi:hypothetical protein
MPPRNIKMKTNTRNIIIAVGIIASVGILAFLFLSPLSPIVLTTTPTAVPSDTTTFTLIDYVNGEDVSDFVEVSLWTPKDDTEFDEYDDVFTMSNYEETEASKDADDVSIDLSEYAYVWVEIDPDAEVYYASTWILISGNAARTFYVYHQASDVDIAVLDTSTMDEWDKSTAAIIKTILDVPHASALELHYGDNWDISTEDYADMTAAEIAEMKDQKYFRCEAPTYDPLVDDEKEYDDGLERLTNAFAIEFDFNDTISLTDGSVTQVNFTLRDDAYPGSSDAPIEIVFSGDKIYVIFHEVIKFTTGAYSLDFDIATAANITCSTVKTGRIVVPRDDDNLGTFTALSTAAL